MAAEIHLRDKVVLVTGASRGIGEAIARACAAVGAKVVLVARKQPDLDRVAATIREAGGTALPIACHAARGDELEAVYRRAADEVGRINCLVNNAATNPYFGPMLECSEAAFDKTFETNLKGYWLAARLLVQSVRGRQVSGSIVNVASVAGLRAAPMQGVYGMTKAAILSMTETLAFELGSSTCGSTRSRRAGRDPVASALVQTRPCAVTWSAARRWAGTRSRTRSPAPRSTCSRTPRRSSPATPWSWTAARPSPEQRISARGCGQLAQERDDLARGQLLGHGHRALDRGAPRAGLAATTRPFRWPTPTRAPTGSRCRRCRTTG